jgi:hypothetical protein
LIVELRRLLELWLHRLLIHHRRRLLVLRLLEPVERERLLKLLLRRGHIVLGWLLIVEDPILLELLLLELAWILLRGLMGLSTSSPSPSLIRLRRSRFLLLLSHLLLQLYPILPLLLHFHLLPLIFSWCFQEELLLLLHIALLLLNLIYLGLHLLLLLIHEPIGTNISMTALVEDFSENLVAKIFFSGPGEYRLNFTRGCLGVKLLSVLSLSRCFVFISLKLVET